MNKMMNRLLRLQALNRNAPREYRIEAREDSNEVAVYLYDIIGYDWWTDGGVTAKQFARDLAPLNGKTIHLHINSPGGDVFEGRAMVAALKKHEAGSLSISTGSPPRLPPSSPCMATRSRSRRAPS